MSKTIIHFSHANGFPAETYRKLFTFLSDEYAIGYLSLHGHHADYPVTDNWTELAKELTDHLRSTYQEPVVGVGHSFGGLLTFLAAIQMPELFKCIVLLDAPILGTLRSLLIRLAKRWGFIDVVTGGKGARLRRTRWPSKESAFEHFRTKPLFRHFDTDCLRDYLDFGMQKTEKGISLRFDPRIEYDIYCTLPHNLSEYRNQLKVPGALLYAERTHAVTALDRRHLKNNFDMMCVNIPGGHLFPFERPQLTAVMIKQTIAQLIQKAHFP